MSVTKKGNKLQRNMNQLIVFCFFHFILYLLLNWKNVRFAVKNSLVGGHHHHISYRSVEQAISKYVKSLPLAILAIFL